MSPASFQDPEVWKLVENNQQPRWLCLACCDGRLREKKHCREHENSEKHKNALTFYRDNQSSAQIGAISSDAAAPDAPSTMDMELDDNEDYENNTNDQFDELSPSYNHGFDDAGDTCENDYDNTGYTIEPTSEEIAIARMSQNITGYSIRGPSLSAETYSDDDEVDDRSDSSSEDSYDIRTFPTWDFNNHWFPWPDKVNCVIDIMRHMPRSTLSDKQNGMISWVLGSLGIRDVPGESAMKGMMKSLQSGCGIKTRQYQGALGHSYYVNDFLGLIAREMANPNVRPHLHFFPEIPGNHFSGAYHASRWMYELEPSLLTPMIRYGGQDYYTFEVTLLSSNIFCVPVRWFIQNNEMFGHAWRLHATQSPFGDNTFGWIVHTYDRITIKASSLVSSFPYLCESYIQRQIPNPKYIYGTILKEGYGLSKWLYTDPSLGNKWRMMARCHRVVAFPIWLYCDDTSGNSSKKWNKHNSYLFTAAGLSYDQIHLEYNVHFLCTSNLAGPLEMLDGIVDQLDSGQRHGVWAWDCVLQEKVLVIPSVLAFLGDNPMQSEIACHIGLNGKLPCRICLVTGTDIVDKENNNMSAVLGTTENEILSNNSGDDTWETDNEENSGLELAGESDNSDVDQNTSAVMQKGKGKEVPKKKGTKKKMTMSDYVDFARRLTKIGVLRNREKTAENLQQIFAAYKTIGRQTDAKKLKTFYGVKDTYQEFFIDKITQHLRDLRGTKDERQKGLDNFTGSLPSNVNNPAWRIKSFDAHQDTPVEILHVVLLGFVKYFWRDAIARLNDGDKAILTTRLSSVNVKGLGLQASHLVGKTLVKYAGSLTGRDFRAIAQVAPFVLYKLLPDECYKSWLALSALLPLIWQPVIGNLDNYMMKLDQRINHLLNCVTNWSPRWFNKTKFHIILHLPNHIRRFGPAILFATETFESYNALIRSFSVHSNRQAPSRDIGYAFANMNRIRHLLSKGKFHMDLFESKSSTNDFPNHGDPSSLDDLKEVGSEVMSLLQNDIYLQRVYAPKRTSTLQKEFEIDISKRKIRWSKTRASEVISEELVKSIKVQEIYITALKSFSLQNDDPCRLYDWVFFRNTNNNYPLIGQVIEILLIIGTTAELEQRPNNVLLSLYSVGSISETYGMPLLVEMGSYALVEYKDILCTINVQHNCAASNCKVANIRQVYQERLKTSILATGIEHHSIKNVVLNTAQMRDSQYLQHYVVEALQLNRDEAIFAGAAREVATQQAKLKSTRNLPENSMLQSVLDPLRGTGRGRARGRGRGQRGRERGNNSEGSSGLGRNVQFA